MIKSKIVRLTKKLRKTLGIHFKEHKSIYSFGFALHDDGNE